MGTMKDYALFCRENELDPSKPSSHRFYERGSVPIVRINDRRDLSWDEVNALTASAVGTFLLPCPYCGPNKLNSRRFRLDRPTLGGARWHCFYCGQTGEARSDVPTDPKAEAAALRAAAAREQETRAERTARALKLWDDAQPVKGSPVIDYLRARAIHDLPPEADGVLRFHPACPFSNGARACMLALFRDVQNDEPRALHRTWIVDRWHGKSERRALGPIAGAAIKLWPLDRSARLIVGEGIETVLSAATCDALERRIGERLTPAWALTVANNLSTLPVLTPIQRLLILSDNDASGTGQDAARKCARRYLAAGRSYMTLVPSKTGADFNDVVRGMVP